MSWAQKISLRINQRLAETIPGRVKGIEPRPVMGTGARFTRWLELLKGKRVKSSSRVIRG